MYTVLRFFGSDPSQLKHLGERINTVFPGAFDGLRKARDGFAVEVTSDDDWVEHKRKLLAYLDASRDVIAESVSGGVSVVADTAIGPEDYDGRRLTAFPLDLPLLKVSASMGIELEFSFYTIPDDDVTEPPGP